MNCRSARRMMSAFLDGELPEIKECRLNQHIDSCSACRVEMNTLRSIDSTLDMWPGIAPTFSLADIKQRAALRRRSRIWNPLHVEQMPRWVTAILAAFAILIGMVGGVGLETMRQPVHQTATATAAVSDILSLGSSNDPMADLVSTEISSGPVMFPSGQEDDR